MSHPRSQSSSEKARFYFNINMSWQQYIDGNLVGTGQVQHAAIIGLDGNIWATSAGFTIDQPEGAALASHFKDGAAKAMASGIHVNKVKYMFIKKDELLSGEDYRLLIGKKGPTGVSIYKSDTAMVIGVYGEGVQPGACNNVVTTLGAYLVSVGY
ncbi:profilin-2-like [Amphiura filiformis]|uniref:profilin-2-like n=1 Tax=Amphiura filiformis TaxID=82378 RepID=UPI003B21615F